MNEKEFKQLSAKILKLADRVERDSNVARRACNKVLDGYDAILKACGDNDELRDAFEQEYSLFSYKVSDAAQDMPDMTEVAESVLEDCAAMCIDDDEDDDEIIIIDDDLKKRGNEGIRSLLRKEKVNEQF